MTNTEIVLQEEEEPLKWIKINPYHRPEKGHAMLATFNPEDGGTLYYVIQVNKDSFVIESELGINGEKIPDDQKEQYVIPHQLIPITNLHVWDRHRESNYE